MFSVVMSRAFLVAEHVALGNVGSVALWLPGLEHRATVAAHRLSYPAACGICSDKGSNAVFLALVGGVFTT